MSAAATKAQRARDTNLIRPASQSEAPTTKKLPGIQVTRSGHHRYTRGKLRNKYVHRVEVEKLIEETPYSVRLLLPWPYEVHHLDYQKGHNCASNLLITTEAFHSAMTADHAPREQRTKKFTPKFRAVPDYVMDAVGVA
jgi:hypothetical protein